MNRHREEQDTLTPTTVLIATVAVPVRADRKHAACRNTHAVRLACPFRNEKSRGPSQQAILAEFESIASTSDFLCGPP
jgi:hypothetical protein